MEERLETIYELINDIKGLESEISRLEKAAIISEEKAEEKTDLVIREPEVIIDEEKELDSIGSEVEFYYKQITSFIPSNNKDKDIYDLSEMLPVKTNPNYYKLYLRILAELNKEEIFYRTEIEENKDIESKETLKSYYDELLIINEKKNLIKEIHNNRELETEKEIQERPNNKLVFLNSMGDRIYALDDIELIPNDFYDKIAELLNSIINGTFKNVRYFHSTNDKLNGVIEVKDFKTRVLFDRVGPHTYAIIAIFLKKSDKDKAYMEFLANRVQTYRNRKNIIISNLEDYDYMEEQSRIEKDLFNIIGYTPNQGRGGV